MSPLRLAWLTLTRHRAATTLALVSLALMIACAGILLRTWQVSQSRFSSLVRTGDALIGAKADPVDMALSALNLEGRYPDFIPLRFATLLNNNWLDKSFSVHITPILFCAKYKGRRVIGTTSDILTQPQPSPRFALESGVWPNQGNGLLVGSETARRERLRVGDEISVSPWNSDSSGLHRPPVSMLVTGILRPMNNAWDGALFTNILQAETVLSGFDAKSWNGDWSRLVVHYLILHVPPNGMEQVRTVVNQRTVVQVASVPETLRTLERMTAAGRALSVAVAILALCLTGIAVSTMMLGRFEGLSRQMAVLEAIGFRKSALLKMLAWEGLLLGLGATGIGGMMDAALFPVFRGLLAGALPSPERVASHAWDSWPVWALVLPAMIGASLLSSLFIFRGKAGERLRGLA